MFSDKELNYSSRKIPSDSIVFSHLSARFIIPRQYQSLVFDGKNSVKPTSTPSIFRTFFHARNGPRIGTDSNLKAQDQRCMLGVVAVRFLPIPEYLSWLFVQFGVAHCLAAREIIFGQLMLGISVSKFHELVPVVENKDSHPLHTRLKQTPSESHLQNATRHTTLLLGRTIYNDDFGWLTETEPLFRGVRVAAIDPFFITCDNFLDKSIIHGITDKLTTDIHSTLNLLWYQFMRYKSIGLVASVWLSKCVNLAMYDIVWCTKFFWQLSNIFLRIFFQNSAYTLFLICHN